MDFVLGKGFSVSGVQGGIARYRPCGVSQRGAVSVCHNGEDSPTIEIFDGYLFCPAGFRHALIGGKSEDGEGIFVSGYVGSGGCGTLQTDPLSQYPLYYYETGGRYLIGNNFAMLHSALALNGIRPGRSFLPCVENLVMGSTAGLHTHIEGVSRVPFGATVHFGDGLRFEQRELPHVEYDEAIEQAYLSIRDNVAALREALPGAYYIADITGGADSRAVLGFVSGIEGLSGRCIRRYPHPDGNVAGMLMERFGIAPGEYPSVGGGRRAAATENAILSGGARDAGAPLGDVAMPDLVHFRGAFGELSGKTPGLDYVAASPDDPGAALVAHAVKAGAGTLLTPQGREHVTAAVNELVGQFDRDQAVAEIYLRTRSHTHFALGTYLGNKTRITPDLLANRWIVAARRALPSSLHSTNKIIFDLMERARPGLAALPFGHKGWHKSLPQAPIVKQDDPPLSGLTGPLFIARFMTPNRSSPDRDSTCQAALAEAIESVSADHAVWGFIDRERLTGFATMSTMPNERWPRMLSRVSSGLFWLAGKETPPAVNRVERFVS